MSNFSWDEVQAAAPAINNAVDKLLSLGIVHNDLNLKTTFIDRSSDTANPVEILNCTSMFELREAADGINEINGKTGRRIKVVQDNNWLGGGRLEWLTAEEIAEAEAEAEAAKAAAIKAKEDTKGAKDDTAPQPPQPPKIEDQIFPRDTCMSAELAELDARLGDQIGEGWHGKVYEDKGSEQHVIKVQESRSAGSFKCLMDEVTCFNAYYGEGSAACAAIDGILYMRMLKVPGVPYASLSKAEQASLIGEYNKMIQRMYDKGFVTDDPQKTNCLYDAKTGMVNPVDMAKCTERKEFKTSEMVVNHINADAGNQVAVRITKNPNHPSGVDLKWVAVDHRGDMIEVIDGPLT